MLCLSLDTWDVRRVMADESPTERRGAEGAAGMLRERVRDGHAKKSVFSPRFFFKKKTFISFCFKFSPPEAFFPFANGTQS
jgi:hypothetical protein